MSTFLKWLFRFCAFNSLQLYLLRYLSKCKFWKAIANFRWMLKYAFQRWTDQNEFDQKQCHCPNIPLPNSIFIKASLDCRLWHWCSYLLQSLPELFRRCEAFLLHHRNNLAFSHFRCFPWSSGPFDVAEFTGAFFLFKNVPNCWFGHS